MSERAETVGPKEESKKEAEVNVEKNKEDASAPDSGDLVQGSASAGKPGEASAPEDLRHRSGADRPAEKESLPESFDQADEEKLVEGFRQLDLADPEEQPQRDILRRFEQLAQFAEGQGFQRSVRVPEEPADWWQETLFVLRASPGERRFGDDNFQGQNGPFLRTLTDLNNLLEKHLSIPNGLHRFVLIDMFPHTDDDAIKNARQFQNWMDNNENREVTRAWFRGVLDILKPRNVVIFSNEASTAALETLNARGRYVLGLGQTPRHWVPNNTGLEQDPDCIYLSAHPSFFRRMTRARGYPEGYRIDYLLAIPILRAVEFPADHQFQVHSRPLDE